ncbi:MAG: sigma-70 family RNA polymerase sigma factor [Planctomycetota bacterium]
MGGPSDTVRLLQRLRAGDEQASRDLLSLLYEELHGIAERLMASERRDHTLQPTALVHDAWVRLVGGSSQFEDRRHFLRTAARAMRRVLVDHARGKRADKRGGGRRPLELDEGLALFDVADLTIDLIALDEALEALGRNDAELLRVVELRYFAGLTFEETGEVLGLSPQQVHRAWGFARAWLRTEMDG